MRIPCERNFAKTLLADVSFAQEMMAVAPAYQHDVSFFFAYPCKEKPRNKDQ
jgi:hypothetical protein